MTDDDRRGLDECLATVTRRLLDLRSQPDHWEGHLASSALSTGTAILALHLACERGSASQKYVGTGFSRPLVRLKADPTHDLETPSKYSARAADCVAAGARWLVEHQNADGGWGDTIRSRSNISTTATVWGALSAVHARTDGIEPALEKAATWLRNAAGDVTPEALRTAILRRYGKDQTFSVPILAVLALSGKIGWRSVPQLPFELAAFQHGWFRHLRLPVVSYALPALIAIGHVRHRFAPSRNPFIRALRNLVRGRTHKVLREIQPESGGYLEAAPLTSFVVMSLAAAGEVDSPVVGSGVRFLVSSMRRDGSWPIDTNLATWVTTLSIRALDEQNALSSSDRVAMRAWLLREQSTREHPFTHAAPGGWAWTPLSGGVPDADDTASALVALRQLGEPDRASMEAAAAGARWLLGVQNRDGGVPTFCRGWGTLPFDRSTPEITAHALRAWSAWHEHLDVRLQHDLGRAAIRALSFLESAQRPDGSWTPLWFGNEHASGEDNPVYGTARVLLGLNASLVRDHPTAERCRRRAVEWLLDAHGDDGGWGGDRGVLPSIEETGVALSALGRASSSEPGASNAIQSGARWLCDAVRRSVPASPIGLYFARLWYFEDLYPLIFALEGLAACANARPAEALRAGSDVAMERWPSE